MRTSVIIPNWNGREHLPVCLESIQRQSRAPDEVIVVDDASTDDSVALLRREFPWVKTVVRPENGGFTATVNTGLAAASGEYVALLNNDTELDPQWLSWMIRALDEESPAGSVACRMIRFHDRAVLDGAGDLLSRACSPYTRGFGEPDDGRYGRRDQVFGACAGAALFRRTVFDTVGGLDEDFVAYYDDVDLAFRAQLAGFRCVYEPSAVCYHKRGATSGPDAIRLQERNLTALHVKNIPGPLLVLLAPAIFLSRTRRLLRLARQGRAVPALRGVLQGLALIPRMLAKRRRVQRMRTVPLRSLRALFGSR